MDFRPPFLFPELDVRYNLKRFSPFIRDRLSYMIAEAGVADPKKLTDEILQEIQRTIRNSYRCDELIPSDLELRPRSRYP